MIRLLGVDPSKVYVQACLYEDHVRAYVARFPEHSLREIQENVRDLSWQLWMVWDTDKARCVAVIGTELHTGQDDRISAHILFCAGRGVRDWVHVINGLENWARDNGAYRIRGMMRPGWERLINGYRRTHVVLEKVLT